MKGAVMAGASLLKFFRLAVITAVLMASVVLLDRVEPGFLLS